MQITKVCPVCGKESTHEFSTKEITRYEVDNLRIQDALPNRSAAERDFMRIGLCFDCFENMYNTPAPGNEDKFGEYVGECSTCGCAVYEKDITEDVFTCPCCKQHDYTQFD